MDLPATEEQRRFRLDIRAWLTDAVPRHLPLALDERFQALRMWQRTLYDAGWIGWGWPSEYGGRGGSVVEQLVVYQELARARAPMPAGLVALEVVGPTIAHYATPDQGRRFVPPLLRGDEIWSQGFSEPDSGSDLASLSTRAVEDGESFVITGQKVWTSWAQYSQWCAVLARTDPEAKRHDGISYLLVDLSSPGVEVRPLVQLTGDAEFSEIFFDSVRVPRSNLLGSLNEGWKVAMATLSFERAPALLRRLTEIRVAFEELTREMCDALSPEELDLIAERVGRCRVLIEAMEARGYRIVDRIRRGERGPEDSVDKLFLTRTEQAVFALALDVLPDRTAFAPGDALTGRRWLHDYLFSRAASIYGGTSEIQRNIVAGRLLGLGRD
jgi:alkylation response protein AidB-like acyl-CoA dehydrogenase